MRVMVATADYPLNRMGGAEYQTLLIAEGLASRGHQVTFLGVNADEEGDQQRDGLRVVRTPGWRRLGAGEHRARLRALLREARPQVVYTRVFDELGLMVPLCKDEGIAAVSASSHARETTPLLRSRVPSEVYMHLRAFLAIGASTVHVCNTRTLAQMAARWYPRHPIHTIYNGSPVPPEPDAQRAPSGQVIWVNNIKRWKRPEAFITLAERLPQYEFVMIGRMDEGRYGQVLQARLQRAPGNLHYLGPKPLTEVNAMIAESDLLLYTSLPVEGFGNSFLQAWFRGVPTVSLSYDLDGIPEREGIGRCAPDEEALAKIVGDLMADHDLRGAMGRRAREYAVRCHSVDAMVSEYEALFRQLAGSP